MANETLKIGSRVCHKTDSNLTEGVVVFVHNGLRCSNTSSELYSVHWNTAKADRGLYSKDDIQLA